MNVDRALAGLRQGETMERTDDMEGGLLRLLADVEPTRKARLESYSRIPGGYSRLTSRADVRWSDGTEASYLLRADPVGTRIVFHSDRDAEWDLLQALRSVDQVAIPVPLWYDREGEYFGTKCMVIEFSSGVPFQGQIEAANDLTAATAQFATIAAAIHSVPLDTLPATLDRPADWNSYIDSVIDVFERTERRVAECIPAMRFVAASLKTRRPPEVPLTLVHGDFQAGNVLVAPGAPPLVIDWEFGRIGDPREDLGYYMSFPSVPNLYREDPEGFLRQYRERTGLNEDQVNVDTVEYFLIIGMAGLLTQLVESAAAIDEGHGGGALATYLINTISYQCDMYVRICRSATQGGN
jgi:aminoglycoside phosphotransferase (APT) family kinase protein